MHGGIAVCVPYVSSVSGKECIKITELHEPEVSWRDPLSSERLHKLEDCPEMRAEVCTPAGPDAHHVVEYIFLSQNARFSGSVWPSRFHFS